MVIMGRGDGNMADKLYGTFLGFGAKEKEIDIYLLLKVFMEYSINIDAPYSHPLSSFQHLHGSFSHIIQSKEPTEQKTLQSLLQYINIFSLLDTGW